MAYQFTVKDKKVLFSNDVVKNLELFTLEFITDAPKLCRLLRKEVRHIRDPFRLLDTSDAKSIRFSQDDDLEEQATFRVRFSNPYIPENALALQVTIREW